VIAARDAAEFAQLWDGIWVVRRIIAALCYAGLLALGAGAAGRIYDGPLFALLVAGAAVGSVGIGLLLVRRPQWTVAPRVGGGHASRTWSSRSGYSAGASACPGRCPRCWARRCATAARNCSPR